LIYPALRQAEKGHFKSEKPDFLEFLRLICPGVRAAHLRMFEEWCNQFDNLVEQQILKDRLNGVTSTFLDNDKKGIIPDDDIRKLEAHFHALDVTGRGYVTLDELGKEWGMDEASLRELFKNNHVAHDTYLDSHDYLRLVCPEEYRLPAMYGSSRDLFGKLLLGAGKRITRNATMIEELFNENKVQQGETREKCPDALLPEVEEETWAQWNTIFSQLDTDSDDMVDFHDLWASELLSQDVCKFVITLLRDVPGSNAFSRNSFLRALLDAQGCRRKLGRNDSLR